MVEPHSDPFDPADYTLSFSDWCLQDTNEVGELDGTVCPPTKGGKGWGDPHFQLWSGATYGTHATVQVSCVFCLSGYCSPRTDLSILCSDFHSECDLVFLKAGDAHGTSLDIHVRTKGRYDYSYIETAAVRVGEDVLEVSSFGSFAINGVADPSTPFLLAKKFPLTHTQEDTNHHTFDIALTRQEHIIVKTFKDLVNVKVENATHHTFGNSTGLLGSFTTGSMLARDGTTVLAGPEEFGQEWQVQVYESKLFQTQRAPQHPQKCTPPSQARSQRRLGEAIAQEKAEKACAGWKQDFQECVFDVMATGDVETAHVLAGF